MQFSMLDDLKQHTLLFMTQNNQSQRFEVRENQHYRWICMDDIVHSVMDLKQPERLVLPHSHTSAIALSIKPNPQSFLELGLGGGNMLRFLHHHFPSINSESVELSSEVIDCFNQYFNPHQLKTQIWLEDAAKHVSKIKQQYDWIYVDIFAGFESPAFLLQSSFYQKLWDSLTTDGLLHLNLIPVNPSQLAQIGGLLSQLTEYKPIIATVPDYQNVMIFMSKQGVTRDQVEQALSEKCAEYKLNPNLFLLF